MIATSPSSFDNEKHLQMLLNIHAENHCYMSIQKHSPDLPNDQMIHL